MANEPDETQQIIQAALQLPNESNFYFNGYACAISSHDAIIVLQRNGKTVAALNCSHTMAKSFVEGLGDLLKGLEQPKTNPAS